MVKFQLNLNSQTALAAAVGEHYRPGIVAAVTMVDNSSVEHRLLVSQPVSSPISMMGQGTRYYWAVDADSRQVVFLKDTWRWNGKRQMEGEILADLHAAGVPNIPQLMYHGDVREPRTQTNEITQPDNDDFEACWALQYTQTDLFCQAHWVSKTVSPFRPLVHYRLVFGTVGYGLEQFRGARELLHGTYDVYQAMLGAFGIEDPAKRRLHCDISLSSIILSRDPNSTGIVRSGYLIDWEISSLMTSDGTACDCSPGTFQFVSQRLLQRSPAAHAIQDDMESLLYVVLYCSLLWLDHNQSLQDLASRVCAIFGSFNTFDHAEEFRSSGGKLKNQYYRIFTSGVRFSDTAIQEWLHAVMRFDSTYMVEYPRDIALAKVWENPAEFNTFWTNFLDGRTISNCDRVSRQLAVPRERSNSWRLSNVLPPAPVRPPRKRRAIARDELVRANAECIIISAPSLPRPDYTGPTTRSMVKRRRIEAPEVGAGPSLDSGINSRSNPRCLRPRPAKPDLTQQGPKNDRSRKRA